MYVYTHMYDSLLYVYMCGHMPTLTKEKKVDIHNTTDEP